MKYFLRTLLPAGVLFIFSIPAFAQEQSLIDVINAGDKSETFIEARSRVAAYFNQIPDETQKNRKGYKQWKRWEWFASSHLDPDGKVGPWSARSEAALAEIAMMPQQSAPNGGWISAGPASINNGENYLGRVECVAFHPTDANTLYVGSATGGLWKTTNQGASWTALTDHLPSLSIGGVAVSPSNGNVIYILTGDGDGGSQWGYYVKERSSGVFRSTDGGNTWYQRGLVFDRSGEEVYGFKLLIQPDNANIIFAATSIGIYRTANAGITWDLVQSGQFTDIEFKPNDFDRIAATRYGQDDLYVSTDNGLTWTAKDVPGSGMTRGELATTAAASDRVYFLMGPQTNGGFRGYYYYRWSTDAFTEITTTPNVFTGAAAGDNDGGFPWWAIALGVSPTSFNNHLVGGVIGRRSTDGGTTIFADHDILHADAHGYWYSPVDGSVYATNDGGIFRSTNNGDTWTNITTGMRITQYYRISTTPQNSSIVLGGTQDNGHHYRTAFSSAFKWVRTCCDGMDNAIDPTNSAIIYSCTQDGGLARSTNSGDDWTDIRPIVSGNRVGGEWVSPFLLHSSTPTSMFFAGDGGIFRSTNSGTNWTNIGADGDDAMAQGISNTARFYAAKGTTLRRSDDVNDATPTWAVKSGTSGWPAIGNLANSKITGIGVHPQNSLEVWVTYSGYNDGFKVMRSTNGGDSWTNVTGSLPNIPVHTIVMETQPNSTTYQVYIGTDIGVFFRSNSSGDWQFFSNFLPRVMVTDLEINGTYIYAGTYGRGIWYSSLQSGCAATSAFNSTYDGEKVFQAGTSITSTGTILSGIGTNVTFRAGSYVDLLEGFHAQGNTIFTAQYGPCNATLPLPGGVVPLE